MGNLKHGKAFHGMLLRGVSKVETKTPTRTEPSAPFALRRFSTSGVVSVVSKQLSHRDAKFGEGHGSLWWDASIGGCHFVTWKWLKLTDTIPETKGNSFSNHPFSGAMLVSGRVHLWNGGWRGLESLLLPESQPPFQNMVVSFGWWWTLTLKRWWL